MRYPVVAALVALSLSHARAFRPAARSFHRLAPALSGAARPGRVLLCMTEGQGEDPGLLGAELTEIVRQARIKAAERAGTGADSKVAAAAPAAATQRLGLPGFQLESFGFKGRWEQAGPSFMLYPPSGVMPKAVVHFLGGAFVGAAPHISYRYMLEDIADNGYIVVTTPYNLIFNYVTLCANVVQDSRAAMSRVPAGLPTIGATKSIPQFEEVIIPFVNALFDSNDASTTFRDTVRRSFEQADETARELAASPFAPLAAQTELLPLTKEGLRIVEQIPGLLEIVQQGEREFFPNTDKVAELLRGCYAVSSTLVVSFNDDSIDESDKVEGTLRVSGSVGSAASVDRVRLQGSHVTPLTQDVFLSTPLDSFDPLLPLRRLARQEVLRPVDALNKKIIPFLDSVVPL